MLSCLLNGHRINCFDNHYNKEQLRKWASKNILLCPACGRPYEYCHGKVKQPYFRHKDKVLCTDEYFEPETEEHLKGKYDFYELIKQCDGVTDVILEGWIPETKQRPDIMFKYNKKQYVLEYQCSPISTEYYKRHNLYQATSIIDIWVCGTEKYFQYYHKGNGYKKICVLEENCNGYYDSNNKKYYTLDILSESMINRLRKETKTSYLMNNPNDYHNGKINYYFIKDISKNYYLYSYYPSGKPSNKYPYPILKHVFSKNYSLAKCVKANKFIVKEFMNE